MKALIALMAGLWLLAWPAAAQHVALHCDGNDDWVRLPLGSTPLAGNPTAFTVETWFQANVTDNDFHRLFSLGSVGTRIEFGTRGTDLRYFLGIPAQSSILSNLATIVPNAWHHLAIVRSGGQIEVFLDCVSVGAIPVTGNPNLQEFRLGAWTGGATTPPQEWEGQLDELRLWGTAVSAADLCNRLNCPLSGQEAGLIAYWDFNETAPGGNNTALAQVADRSPNGNDGIIYIGGDSPISLTGNSSNFVGSTAPLAYPALHGLDLEIRDYPYQAGLLSDICSGDPAQFCLDDQGAVPGPYSNVTVAWQYSDDGGATWLPLAGPVFQDYCFPVPPGILTLDCASSTAGFIDRKYRAVSTAMDPVSGLSCAYESSAYDLRITCPLSPASVAILPSGPFCEGEAVSFQVNLNSPDPFVSTPGPNVSINWYLNDPVAGRSLLPFSGQSSFTFSYTAPQVASPRTVCIEAEVANGAKAETYEKCFTIDPEPECGIIEGWPIGMPANLELASPLPNLAYEICPGNDATLGIDPANPFNDCIPQWQYTFDDPAVVASPAWSSMGLSNTLQNTNILPSHLWPSGATSIFYRIECQPLSSPSGCAPCYGNIIEVRLKAAPILPVVAGPTEVCVEGLPAVLAIQNIEAGVVYTWLHNGLPMATGPTSLPVNLTGCYWVEASNGCQVVESARHCVDVCETIARLSCPLPPNACATPGEPVTVTACASENTCSGTSGLLFEWFVDGVSQGAASSACDFTHTPALTGTAYKVLVTDPATGCMGIAEQVVVPCVQN